MLVILFKISCGIYKVPILSVSNSKYAFFSWFEPGCKIIILFAGVID